MPFCVIKLDATLWWFHFIAAVALLMLMYRLFATDC
jgi:hypothetical protein